MEIVDDTLQHLSDPPRTAARAILSSPSADEANPALRWSSPLTLPCPLGTVLPFNLILMAWTAGRDKNRGSLILSDLDVKLLLT